VCLATAAPIRRTVPIVSHSRYARSQLYCVFALTGLGLVTGSAHEASHGKYLLMPKHLDSNVKFSIILTSPRALGARMNIPEFSPQRSGNNTLRSFSKL
jgi:hypothetical protein